MKIKPLSCRLIVETTAPREKKQIRNEMTSSRLPENDDNNGTRRTSDFSIEHILNRAGVKEESRSDFLGNESNVLVPFPWLQCTRYSPPKIPRKFPRQSSSKQDKLKKCL